MPGEGTSKDSIQIRAGRAASGAIGARTSRKNHTSLKMEGRESADPRRGLDTGGMTKRLASESLWPEAHSNCLSEFVCASHCEESLLFSVREAWLCTQTPARWKAIDRCGREQGSKGLFCLLIHAEPFLWGLPQESWS